MNPLRKILSGVPVLPVLTIERVEHAAPLAQALVDGGLNVLEVTLRTPAALHAIEAMRTAGPDAIIAAGTVINAEQLRDAKSAGAHFAVSPGLDPELVSAVAGIDLPLLPGVMTPSEAMQAWKLGFDTLKLFPASAAGGTAWLRAVAAPLPQLAFCPTGGIDAATVADYLALPNVLCVGGSWIAPAERIRAADWQTIHAAAQALTRGRRLA